jgi:hypothetical protein
VELAEHLGCARLGNLLEVIADRRVYLRGKGISNKDGKWWTQNKGSERGKSAGRIVRKDYEKGGDRERSEVSIEQKKEREMEAPA